MVEEDQSICSSIFSERVTAWTRQTSSQKAAVHLRRHQRTGPTRSTSSQKAAVQCAGSTPPIDCRHPPLDVFSISSRKVLLRGWGVVGCVPPNIIRRWP